MKDELKSLREASGQALVRIGRENRKVVVLEADIGKSTKTSEFRREFPERYFNIGVAEANMVGIAAGLATTDLIPICSSYATFLSMRACETIRQSVCYPGLNVKFVATHGGLATGVDGASHQAIEDIAIFRTFPGTCVLVPSDATMVYPVYKAAMSYNGPVYVRLMRDPVPLLYSKPMDITLGKAWVLEDGEDVTLWCTGIMVSVALEARELLAGKGIKARVVDSPCVKPLDRELLTMCARETGCLVSCEDHLVNGGTGSAVAEALGEEMPVPIARIGLKDTFGESGKREQLFEHYAMGAADIARAALHVVEMKNRDWRRENGQPK